ncbi:MAG: hypothetical protein M3300_11215, partial [Actinomycetota bacterium]|nr:hypothetical protein [Actinomycetota bacterium]
ELHSLAEGGSENCGHCMSRDGRGDVPGAATGNCCPVRGARRRRSGLRTDSDARMVNVPASHFSKR